MNNEDQLQKIDRVLTMAIADTDMILNGSNAENMSGQYWIGKLSAFHEMRDMIREQMAVNRLLRK